MGSVILFMDSAAILILPLYHRFLSKNWLYFQMFSLGLNAFSAISLFIIPESPKYLIGRAKFEEARESLCKIARFNGVGVAEEIRHLRFETEGTKENPNDKIMVEGSLKDLVQNR